jgi:hypothetical protein
MKNPITLTSWISEELEKGAPSPQHAIYYIRLAKMLFLMGVLLSFLKSTNKVIIFYPTRNQKSCRDDQ